MNLMNICKDIKGLECFGDLDREITNLSQDSRDPNLAGGLYFAVSGTVVDGHTFIPQVISQGIHAVVCEHLPSSLPKGVTFIKAENIKKVMGLMASNFYHHPSQELSVIAVTGTNGKTSVATYISNALEFLDAKVLLLSTAGDYFEGKKIEVNRKAGTSLEILELHRIMRVYVDKGASYCCLEATSIALDQERLSGIDIDVAIFTNLSRDHIDYHKNFEDYGYSKSLLFKHLKKDALAITNLDDPFGKKIVTNTKARVVSYGHNKRDYDYSFITKEVNFSGTKCFINDQELQLPVIGTFNIYNSTAAFATLSELALPTKNIVDALEHMHGVKGRMEMVENSHKIFALVDYAHSPDALENVLATLKDIPHKNIITVFGCGGDRDRGKRPQMARIGQQMSDKVIYTSDNPRTESLDQIFNDMREGIDPSLANFYFVESRDEAIRTAVNIAIEDDIILIAGKGHEDYQIVGDKKLPFDDSQVLSTYLNQI